MIDYRAFLRLLMRLTVNAGKSCAASDAAVEADVAAGCPARFRDVLSRRPAIGTPCFFFAALHGSRAC